MEVNISGKKVRLDPANAIGQGGEAYVFRYGSDAVKIFKRPEDPDFANDVALQSAVRHRLNEHQNKLKSFPQGFPSNVIVPQDFAYGFGNEIMGYTMKFLSGSEPLMRYKQRAFRQQGVNTNSVVKVFENLHLTVEGIHRVKTVLGDFNDLNVLVLGEQPSIIDADSFQFGSFYCRMYTDRFVDPMLCDSKQTKLVLIRPHTPESDWYAFTVMLFESMLFVDPYGGVYKPQDKKKQVPHGARPLKRITVFDPEVRYPKPATPYKVLPDDLLQHFHLVFQKDQRGTFPSGLLKSLRWTKCSKCGTEHARAQCPECFVAAPAAITSTTVVKGQVTATRIFKTNGVIISAAYQGKLVWLYHENDAYKRDASGTELTQAPLDPFVRYRLQQGMTHMAKGSELITLAPGQKVIRRAVDTYGNLPMFDSNSEKLFWLQGGKLMREGILGNDFPETIGEVLQGQTLFWMGPSFGFGFYRAMGLTRAFVFNHNGRAINDGVNLPRITGQLVDSTCVFTKDWCWFFLATQDAGRTKHLCFVISPSGAVQASASAEAGDGTWLGHIRGNAASGNFLFTATDEGLARIEVQGGQMVHTKTFSETEPFVSSDSQLFVSREGMYVVDQQQINLLKIG